MAQIIQFPKAQSNVFGNLSRLIQETGDPEALEFYAGTLEATYEEGSLLPGEMELLTEQVRKKRLDLARPSEVPAVKADKPGLYGYCPEMGEGKPKCQIEASRSYYGRHYHIYTPLDLKGRGIEHMGVLEPGRVSKRYEYRTGWNEYTVTSKAFEKLQEQYTISMESLLD